LIKIGVEQRNPKKRDLLNLAMNVQLNDTEFLEKIRVPLLIRKARRSRFQEKMKKEKGKQDLQLKKQLQTQKKRQTHEI